MTEREVIPEDPREALWAAEAEAEARNLQLAKSACAEAEALIKEGWFQVSRDHYMLARFPDAYRQYAEPGTYALLDAATNFPESGREAWVRRLGEASAGDMFLRVYAPEDCKKTVSVFVFMHYRGLGGGPYRGTGGPRA